MKIIIVGAGIAGLAAANHLSAQGIDAMILEARDRCGGRIWVDRSLGVPLGKGASWLHGIEGNPLIDFLNHDTYSFFNSDLFYTYDDHGERIAQNKLDHFSNRFDNMLIKAKDYTLAGQKDVSLFSALSHVFDSQQLSAIEKILFLRRLKFFENYMGADYSLLSARNWDEELSLPGGNAIVTDGYESALNKLIDNCNIKLQTVVKSIEIENDIVKVSADKDSWDADAVIVTVPLSILKENIIHFHPELSLEKKHAISRIGMGLFNIYAMRFPFTFWDNHCHAFFIPEPDSCSMFFNIGHFTKLPILLGYVGGVTARNFENNSDENIMNRIMDSLNKYFTHPIPLPEHFFVTRWLGDPWSRGSYSYLGVGATSFDRDHLAEPIENKIYFAGEATHRQFPATTHGAYLSGRHVAEEIVRLARHNVWSE